MAIKILKIDVEDNKQENKAKLPGTFIITEKQLIIPFNFEKILTRS